MLGRGEQRLDAVAGTKLEAGANEPPVARLSRGGEISPADEKGSGLIPRFRSGPATRATALLRCSRQVPLSRVSKIVLSGTRVGKQEVA